MAQPAAAVLAVWLLMLSINPVGYVGGGSDDGRYLEAARCIVAHQGWCVPTVHWAARWPVVLPLAGAISIFGETRAALGLSSAIWAVAAIVLLTSIVQKWANPAAALIAGAALTITPVFALLSLSPNADLPELTFLLAALFFFIRRQYWTAGLMLGLAIAARETATVALLPLALGCLVSRPPTATMLRGAFGLAMPLAIEAVWHAGTANDAFLRLHLAMAHIRIPSTELAGAVSAGSPLFNVELIRNWRPAMGIRVHWLLDPLLNLLANPACGLTFLAAIALMHAGDCRCGGNNRYGRTIIMGGSSPHHPDRPPDTPAGQSGRDDRRPSQHGPRRSDGSSLVVDTFARIGDRRGNTQPICDGARGACAAA
ncbi:ArnT family glycosyltransferase [uncultured Sphingomonas sp.]|uniref:ArnT family glycosyltransferase n=1 Tax=uncultured Sphingomonas sp. TaxID=158754 RepID=UPI0035CCA948